MADFVKLAKTAKRLIDKNGRTVTIRYQGSTPIDANEPWRGQAETTPIDVTGKGVFVDPSPFTLGQEAVRDTSKVSAEKKVLLFAANSDGGTDLVRADTVVDGASEWRVTKADLLQPGDVRMIYKFEVER